MKKKAETTPEFPRETCGAFAIFTYNNSRLLMPELVQKWDEDHEQFRGHILDADTLEIET